MRSYLITGGCGSLGRALGIHLRATRHCNVWAYDFDGDARDDILLRRHLGEATWRAQPDVVFHLAAAKHAPRGEIMPEEAVRVNLEGTRNVLEAARACHARVVFASTCKAVEPETVYGATKLIGERMVLNAGGTVLRLVNVRESSENVFAIWDQQEREGQPLTVMPGRRYFISLGKAVAALTAAAIAPPGRYAPLVGRKERIADIALQRRRDTGIELRFTDRRRGDRYEELLLSRCERWASDTFPGLRRIVSEHDHCA